MNDVKESLNNPLKKQIVATTTYVKDRRYPLFITRKKTDDVLEVEDVKFLL